MYIHTWRLVYDNHATHHSPQSNRLVVHTCCGVDRGSEVLDDAILPKRESLAFYTMNVLETNQQGRSGESRKGVVYLYALVPGHVTPSFGVYCARTAGVPETVLVRALQIIKLDQKGNDDPVPFHARIMHMEFRGLLAGGGVGRSHQNTLQNPLRMKNAEW